tara:strand:+ start:782 stop:1015 length:234 start_codon:yes stop_codon:yes gene_type:complete
MKKSKKSKQSKQLKGDVLLLAIEHYLRLIEDIEEMTGYKFVMSEEENGISHSAHCAELPMTILFNDGNPKIIDGKGE